jgi:hypothetical protein
MTTEQKISILIRKYGSKAVIQDNASSLTGAGSLFSNNKVVPSQVWIDLKDVPSGKNPLVNSPTNLAKWPSASDAVIVKIIKKPLTWIRGTNAFYDPGLDSDPSTVMDVISPDVDLSYAPYVYALNTVSNRYLEPLSPNKYSWVFDYETGCLVFVDGLPSFMKSPQFQPPAVTCYRYLGRKTADGIGTGLSQGPIGPTGPTGITGAKQNDAMVWKGIYDPNDVYLLNDTVYNDGIIWVKKDGPTGPTAMTSAYFDSLTYNELVDGFISSSNEQYVDVQYSPSQQPYFENLDDVASSLLVSSGNQLRNVDQNINVFSISGDQDFTSGSLPPFSNRLFFFSPEKISSELDFVLSDPGYRLLSLSGLYANNFRIETNSSLNIKESRLIGTGTTDPYGSVNYLPNSRVVKGDVADLTASLSKTFFDGMEIDLSGNSRVEFCDIRSSTIKLGDPGFSHPTDRQKYSGIIHYFKDCRIVDTKFIAEYTGEYEEITVVLERCRIEESRSDLIDAGFTFPDRPAKFDLSNPNLIRINLIIIDSEFTCSDSIFNFFGGTNMIMFGINVFPQRVLNVNTNFIQSGIQTNDPGLIGFLARQNSYSDVNPRATTNFYFNQ